MLSALMLCWLAGAAWGQSPSAIDEGRSLYESGLRADGTPLVATREGGGRLVGKEAACITCHRPSGLGSVEGNILVPPITGRALFGQGEPVTVRADRRFQPGVLPPHPPYDPAGFGTAVRQGRNFAGRALSALMPRYLLSDQELASLAAYLATLSAELAPGVSAHEIRLATVVLPDVAPERRKAFLATIDAVVRQINLSIEGGLRQKIPVFERREHSRRKFVLDVWELAGPAATWEEQLRARQGDKPVFAVLSGIGETWSAVQNFCEAARVACWFPSIDVTPEDAEAAHYSLYYSAGTRLEADVAARAVLADAPAGARVLQWHSPGAAARAGAERMAARLAAGGATVSSAGLRSAGSACAAAPEAAALASLHGGDTLVLWLSPAELACLRPLTLPAGVRVMVSGLLARGDQPDLPASWLAQSSLIQILEYPAMRDSNLTRFRAWVKDRALPATDERMQAEVHFAAQFLRFVITGMLNNLHPEYLIERAEVSLEARELMMVQDEIQALSMAGGGRGPLYALAGLPSASAQDTPKLIERMLKRRGNTPYPRLSLAAGQRFASRGAYLLPLSAAAGESEPIWLIP